MRDEDGAVQLTDRVVRVAVAVHDGVRVCVFQDGLDAVAVALRDGQVAGADLVVEGFEEVLGADGGVVVQ